MSADMNIVNDPTDKSDSAFKRIQTPTDHGTIHVRYRLADAAWVSLCADINERLNEFGIYEDVDDRGVPGDICLRPGTARSTRSRCA